MPSIGASPARKEGPEKLTGRTRYVDDLPLPGCLYAATLRSTRPHAKIVALEKDPAFDWSDVYVKTAADIPGENVVTLIEKDQPLLAEKVVRHVAEPIALVAAPTRQKAYAAVKALKVEYKDLKPLLDPEDALRRKVVLYKKDNVFKDILIQKGNINAGFGAADHVIESVYRVPAQEQAYIENNGMAAWVDDDGVLTVQGSMQCPYYIHKALQAAFKLGPDKVRVIQAATGGGFGGKEEFPSVLAGHAALLAWSLKKPVKLIYDRGEDMLCSTKRHPGVIRHRTGVTKSGRIVAQDIDVLFDGGAYMTLSPVVLSRGAIHAAGPYECENVRIHARAVATTTPPNGAYRGFGAPQTLFAAEMHAEKLAEKLGMTPAKFRRKNLLKVGSSTATSQILKKSVGSVDVLDAVLERSDFEKKRAAHEKWNAAADKPTWRGIGLAVVYHGAGFTGSGEDMLKSRAGVALTPEGELKILAASTEIGQGKDTTFAQIAADALGTSYDLLEVETPDTARVPDSGPTVASRTLMIVGGLVAKACAELAAAAEQALGKPAKTKTDWKHAAEKLCVSGARREFIAQYERPAGSTWDDKNYRGDAYGSFGYAAMTVDLEVDKATYAVRIDKVHAAFDIGKAVHPLLAEGQILGGVTQAIGWALYEKPVYKDGFMRNAHFTDYVIPTAPDTPAMDVHIVEKPYEHGPSGAKGLGEIPMDIPAPAIAAALRQAVGHWFDELPVLPENIAEALA